MVKKARSDSGNFGLEIPRMWQIFMIVYNLINKIQLPTLASAVDINFLIIVHNFCSVTQVFAPSSILLVISNNVISSCYA